MIDVRHGDCIEVMHQMLDNSVDCIVTDPPYGLGFMGKKWDDLPPGLPWAQECLRVLKPGGHILAFGGTRTWFKLAGVIDEAGFQMLESIAWLFGSGMPKSRNHLKPGFEPVVVARKPLIGSVTQNVEAYGTGALNIEAGRIDGVPRTTHADGNKSTRNGGPTMREGFGVKDIPTPAPAGRWPANVILDEDQAVALDQQTGNLSVNGPAVYRREKADAVQDRSSYVVDRRAGEVRTGFGDSGGASRFFYVAKAPKSERPVVNGVAHPTVKPLTFMRWLVRIFAPPGGTVLDPFAGSGTTIEACILEGFPCIGIEREADYLPLIQARIFRAQAAVSAQVEALNAQLDLFGDTA